MKSIRTRTTAATVALLVVAMGTVVFGVNAVAGLTDDFKELGDRQVPAQVLLLNIDRDSYQAQLALEQVLAAPDAETRSTFEADFEENQQQTEERFGLYQDVALQAEGETDRWPTYDEARTAWVESAQALIAATPLGAEVDQAALASERELFQTARDLIDGISGDIYEQVIPTKVVEVNDTGHSQQVRMIVAAVIALAVGLFVLWTVRKGLRPLPALVQTAERLAKGEPSSTDLEVDAAGTEVGQLTEAFHQLTDYVQELSSSLDAMANGDLSKEPAIRGEHDQLGKSVHVLGGSLREVVGRLREAVVHLSGSSRQLVDMSGRLDATVSDTSTQASAAAAAGQQMHASIRDVAHNAAEAVSVSGHAVDLAGRASEMVSRLEQSSGEIGAVLEVISSIAAQTNLLALNATIEAARAGEAGRGFAVVADEVKHLATQTTEATEGVRTRVAAIQSDTEQAITSISAVTGIIATISEHMHGIASAVEEQEATTNEIARSIEQVAGAADSARSVTTAASHAAGELDQLAASLDQTISRFTGV